MNYYADGSDIDVEGCVRAASGITIVENTLANNKWGYRKYDIARALRAPTPRVVWHSRRGWRGTVALRQNDYASLPAAMPKNLLYLCYSKPPSLAVLPMVANICAIQHEFS